jgi:hypothetical protein
MFVLCELVCLHRTSRAESDGLSNPDIKLFVFVFCWAWYPGFGTKAEADNKILLCRGSSIEDRLKPHILRRLHLFGEASSQPIGAHSFVAC